MFCFDWLDFIRCCMFVHETFDFGFILGRILTDRHVSIAFSPFLTNYRSLFRYHDKTMRILCYFLFVLSMCPILEFIFIFWLLNSISTASLPNAHEIKGTVQIYETNHRCWCDFVPSSVQEFLRGSDQSRPQIQIVGIENWPAWATPH